MNNTINNPASGQSNIETLKPSTKPPGKTADIFKPDNRPSSDVFDRQADTVEISGQRPEAAASASVGSMDSEKANAVLQDTKERLYREAERQVQMAGMVHNLNPGSLINILI